MIRDFTKEELEPVATSSDTEFTLGGGTLLLLAGALLMLCGVCFGLGYAVGHRGTTDQAASAPVTESTSKSSPTKNGSGAKPGAASMSPTPSPPASASDHFNDQDGGPSNANSAAPTSYDPGSHSDLKSATNPQGRSGGAPGASQPSGTLKVQPATAQTQGWMVQIAAISNPEDAQVLVDALRKRGYEVAARRELGDNMIHVQTGPFVNRNDANAMRQKLLNDGYNAIVQ